MIYTKRMILDFTAKSPPKIITAKQNDTNSRVLIITPAADGQKIDMNNITAVFFAEKPDGKFVFNSCINDSDSNIVVNLTMQTLIVCGFVKCEIKLYQNDIMLSSCPFYIRVVESIGENTVESTDEHTILTGLIDKCNKFLNSGNSTAERHYSSAYETVNLNPEIKTYKEETAQ